LLIHTWADEAPVTSKPANAKGVEIEWGLKIPLRDSVRLNGTVYKPQAMTEPLPVIFTLTPYIADSYHERGVYFAKSGYVFVIVDARGRGNSEGQFEPFLNEGRDGHDIVEWLAAQPWCNGKVAMWGGSYGGFDQWAALKEFPPHLATIVPAAAAHPGVDFPAFNNVFASYETQWLTLTSGLTPNANLFKDNTFWIGRFREMYLNHVLFRELDRVVGNPSPHFQMWLEHPDTAAYWDKLALTPNEYQKIDIPILTITGHYDGDQAGAMHFYRSHMQHGSTQACERHYLVIGPWDHAGTRTPTKEVGGLKFGDASIVDLNHLHKQWYDWTMKNGERPDFLKQRVAYYVAGAEEWKYAESLEAIPTARRSLYLNSNGCANDVFHSGMLSQEPPGASAPDEYTYDPLDVRPADIEREEVKDYLVDQRYALNLFGSGLVYHSEPFETDTEITGYIKLVAWMSLDMPDTDFAVDVYEIMPSGMSILLTQDMQRARYRESRKEATLVTPGQVNRYEFSSFPYFSRRIAKGSRLRLVIRAPNSIYWQKNYNSGGDVSTESAKDARTARVVLYHDAEHPSVLELPAVN
jgi:putative CocE/NonD family hydrolase